MTAHQPWSIERIAAALGNPTLAQRFLGEINKAPAYRVMEVFAKWQGVAERLEETAARVEEARAAEAAGLPIPGEWVDVTEEVQAEAARIRARGAA
ncbi:hypothetical protein [Kitasatospora sp. NPDC127116]|uniref:hypothetical protein n=1 Tax=Kitasatospora sp. NPDC127116 TaxID=3345367 RepID=UPI003629AC90